MVYFKWLCRVWLAYTESVNAIKQIVIAFKWQVSPWLSIGDLFQNSYYGTGGYTKLVRRLKESWKTAKKKS